MYSSGILRSVSFDFPLIGIGNLRVGGTGKTPMTEYIIRYLNNFDAIAVLSRGYGRASAGFQISTINSTAEEIGDEPCQIKRKFPNTTVAVCADRLFGVRKLIKTIPELRAVILDDVFQHRRIKPGLMILLTTYDSLYVRDYVLPAGMLRECKDGAKRADIIVVTKCPVDLDHNEKRNITKLLKVEAYQKLVFAYEKYAKPYSISDGSDMASSVNQVILVTGIARVGSLKAKIEEDLQIVKHFEFRDHYAFTKEDINVLASAFAGHDPKSTVIITTEKDATRLKKHLNNTEFSDLPIYALPVEVDFSDQDKHVFNSTLDDYIRSY